MAEVVYAHRSADDFASTLVDMRARSLRHNVDWNGDTFRLLLDLIADSANIASGGDFDLAESWDSAEKVRRSAAPVNVNPGAFQSASVPTVSEVAAEVVRQLREIGFTSPVPPAGASALRTATISPPDETVPAPYTARSDYETLRDEEKPILAYPNSYPDEWYNEKGVPVSPSLSPEDTARNNAANTDTLPN